MHARFSLSLSLALSLSLSLSLSLANMQEVNRTVDRIKKFLHAENIHSSTIQTEILGPCDTSHCDHTDDGGWQDFFTFSKIFFFSDFFSICWEHQYLEGLNDSIIYAKHPIISSTLYCAVLLSRATLYYTLLLCRGDWSCRCLEVNVSVDVDVEVKFLCIRIG